MNIDVSREGEITVVAPHGDLDLGTADRIRRALTDLVDKGQPRLLLDLGGVGYVDSSGLGAIVAALKHARSAGGDLRLCALGDDVHAIFEMTRLLRAITAHATRQDALAAWR